MHMESNASRIELDPVLLPPEPGVLEVRDCNVVSVICNLADVCL